MLQLDPLWAVLSRGPGGHAGVRVGTVHITGGGIAPSNQVPEESHEKFVLSTVTVSKDQSSLPQVARIHLYSIEDDFEMQSGKVFFDSYDS